MDGKENGNSDVIEVCGDVNDSCGAVANGDLANGVGIGLKWGLENGGTEEGVGEKEGVRSKEENGDLVNGDINMLNGSGELVNSFDKGESDDFEVVDEKKEKEEEVSGRGVMNGDVKREVMNGDVKREDDEGKGEDIDGEVMKKDEDLLKKNFDEDGMDKQLPEEMINGVCDSCLDGLEGEKKKEEEEEKSGKKKNEDHIEQNNENKLQDGQKQDEKNEIAFDDGVKKSVTKEVVDNECRKRKEGGGGGEGQNGDKEIDYNLPYTASSTREEVLSTLNVPVKLPDIVEIKKALPAHCFVPSLMTSLYFMAKDFALAAGIYFFAEWSWKSMPLATQIVITPVVWIVQGVVFTGIFVVGHDAGHGSFSKWTLINDLCGNICHSFLFCPYFMWKLSHKNHHKHTANMDKEEVYYPVREAESKEFYNGLLPGFGLGIGWFTYLVQGYRPRPVDHYNPFHPMFSRHVTDCITSFIFLLLWAACLFQYTTYFGVFYLVYHWVIPTLVFGSFIVIITFLHHTDVEVPWYSDELWSYVRGQLSSVDRHYGWCHHIIHQIGTHQVHHLFPMIPHYHLEEATAVFRQRFPSLVRIKYEAILPAFYRMFHKYATQNVIPDQSRVHYYK